MTLSLFLEAYVRFFAAFLPALALGMVALAAMQARLPMPRVLRAVAVGAAALGLWFAVAAGLTQAGIMMPPSTATEPPFILMMMLGGAALLWALVRWTPTGRAISDSADQRLLIGFQIPRVMGFVFLIGWAYGAIPWQFALPAGLGDVWAGVAAYQAYRAVDRGDANAPRLVMRANVIGLLDFVVAVLTGLMTSEGFLHLMSRDAPNIINAWPLGLFPSFFVGLFIAVHLLSIGALRRGQRPTPLRA